MSTDTPRKPRPRGHGGSTVSPATPPPVTDPPPTSNTLEPVAGQLDQKLATQGSQRTLYEVSRQVHDVEDDADVVLWRPVARLEAADAKTAAKVYAESVAEFAGGELRVVPVRNITSVTVGVETRRQLTIT